MRKGIVLLAIICFIVKGFAQDVNFMMYSNTSLNVNPAIISTSDDFKVSVSYLNKSFINEIHAQSAFFMLSRPLYKKHKRYGGFGFSVLSDKGGSVNQLSYEGFTVAYAHEIKLTSWSRISLGLQAGYFLKHLGTEEFTTGNQWVDGSGYDPAISNGESFEKQTVGNFTLSSGLSWYIPAEDRSVKSYLGFSMYNLTKPSFSFFDIENQEPFKYVVSAGHEVYRIGNFSIMPHILYFNSYHQNNWNFGSKWSYRFKVQKGSWLFSSGSVDLITDYQISEGAIVGIQVNQPGFSSGIGYGFSDNFSSQFTPDKGTVEISFSIKKSLFREPKKQRIVSDDEYYKGQERELVFKKPEEPAKEEDKIVEKDEVKDVKKDIKRDRNREVKFKLEKDFQFGFNEAGLNDEAKSYLDDIVILLVENEMLNIEVIGHTDNVGARDANKKISEQRAMVVKQYLVEKGINAKRIKTRGEADKLALFDNDTEEHRSMNRRVEFVIYY